MALASLQWDSEYVYIFMEYVGGGDLSSFLKTEKHLSEKTIRYFLQQLAFALHYLYERNIVHMDVKPQNILLTTSKPPILKLADFGFAKSMEETVRMNEVRGSLLYLAPEIYKYGVYDKSCDLWSVGIILYQCLFGNTPFHCISKKGVKAKLLEDTPISRIQSLSFDLVIIVIEAPYIAAKPSDNTFKGGR
nr:serine:threonine protein kinase ULK3 [Hymenolepis microstoma]